MTIVELIEYDKKRAEEKFYRFYSRYVEPIFCYKRRLKFHNGMKWVVPASPELIKDHHSVPTYAEMLANELSEITVT